MRGHRVSCITLYAMQVAGGVPVVTKPGVCPMCESLECELARMLALEADGMSPVSPMPESDSRAVAGA